MTFSEVQSVGLPQKKEEVHFEGDSYNIIYVLQCAGGAISGLFGSDAKIARIETFSPQFSSSAGVGVGSSLRAIKLAYPDGNLIFGVADGRYLRYLTHTHLIFDFDPNLLPSSCYTKKDSGCSLRDVDAARKVVVDQQIARI